MAQAMQKKAGQTEYWLLESALQLSSVVDPNNISSASSKLHAIDFSKAENDFLWTSVDCNPQVDALPTLKRRVQQFEDQCLKALVTIVCAGCTQKIVTEAFMYGRHLEDTLNNCDVDGSEDLLNRVSLAYGLLVSASHHREMLVTGNDPKGFYTLSDQSIFSPPEGTLATASAKFFVGRAASVDFLSQRAMDTNEGLDEAYHVAHVTVEAMNDFVADKEHLPKSDVETSRAVAVVQALIVHMVDLQKALNNHGATPGVAAKSEHTVVDATSTRLEEDPVENEFTGGPVIDHTSFSFSSSSTSIATRVTSFLRRMLSSIRQLFLSSLAHLPNEDFQAASQSTEASGLSTHAAVETPVVVDAPSVAGQFVWSSVDCAFPSVASIQLEVRVKRFEENTLSTVVDAICAKCSQKNMSDALAYAEKLQDSLRDCSIPGSEVLVARVQGVIIDLVNASHHRDIVAAGKATDPVYAVDSLANFTPLGHLSPRESSDWYMAKVASIDYLTQKAIDADQHIDDVFHSCHRLQLSMVHFLSLREDLGKKDFGTFRAKKVIRELQVYVTQLEELLRDHGAHSIVEGSLSGEPTPLLESPVTEAVFSLWTEVQCTPRADAEVELQQRVEDLENKSLLTLLETVCTKCSQKSVSATFAFARHLQNALAKCNIGLGKTLRNHVDAIIDELAKASHHRVLVASGRDPRGLYAISDEAKFSPQDGAPPAQACQFFLGKVTSIDLMAREAIDQNEGLAEALKFAHRLYLAMSRFISVGDNLVGDRFTIERATTVLETLQSYLIDLQNMLRDHGAELGADE